MPIGSHMVPSDAGYVDLTGVNPYNPEKAKALLKEAGVPLPLNVTLTLPPPPYARKGGEIIAAELAKVGVVAKIENVEWAQWLSGAFKGNFDLTVISHVEPLDFDRYGDPHYYYGYDSKAYRDLLTAYNTSDRPEDAPEAARRHPAPARDRLRRRLPVPAAAVRGRQQAPEGPVEQLADLRQRPRRASWQWPASRHGHPTRQPASHHDRPARPLRPTELVARFRDRSLSPVEVTHAVLDRIAAWEPHLHATYALDADAALAAARVSESRWLRHRSAGENVGALEGVPTMIKENIATAGTPVPLGTAATELVAGARDAPPAARLREAGAVILGKTTMPDYGMLSSGLSSFHGLTRNPWDLSKNPGGSSAGAGAAAAAGYGPLHARHRHRRLGAAAGQLVRHLHAQAEPRPHPDRPALCRPGRRADDAQRRRRGADDGRAGPARRARHDEPAGRSRSTGSASSATSPACASA